MQTHVFLQIASLPDDGEVYVIQDEEISWGTTYPVPENLDDTLPDLEMTRALDQTNTPVSDYINFAIF